MRMTLVAGKVSGQMNFAHDTEVALRHCAALVNTAPSPGTEEGLPDVASLQEFVTAWEWSGSRTHDRAELDAVRSLRPRLRRLWEADELEVVEQVNALLAEAGALPQLVTHGDYGWHVHATPPEAPLHQRMQVEVAMAMVDLVRTGELARLRVCEADDCEHVLVDLSKNRSRRYCESGCGNRLAVAAYRARRNR